jgi:hypothetical protein
MVDKDYARIVYCNPHERVVVAISYVTFNATDNSTSHEIRGCDRVHALSTVRDVCGLGSKGALAQIPDFKPRAFDHMLPAMSFTLSSLCTLGRSKCVKEDLKLIFISLVELNLEGTTSGNHFERLIEHSSKH